MTLIHRRALIAGLAGLFAGGAATVRPAAADPGPPASPPDALFGSFGPLTAPTAPAPPQADLDHTAWVAHALARMQSVRAGMTRAQLETLFAPAGGLHALRTTAPLVGVYAYRECPYFQVDVEFRPARPPEPDGAGGIRTPPDPQDVITSVSRPSVADVASD